MSGSVNKVILVGNLGRDPEVRTMGQSGGKVANLRIATSESWKDKSTGERKEKTEWHSVSIFQEGIVGVVERFLKKGSKVYIEGQLQTRKYTGSDGVEKYSTEVVLQGYTGVLTMLDGPNGAEGGEGGGERGGDRGGSGGGRQGGGNSGGGQRSQAAQTRDFDDDDVPF